MRPTKPIDLARRGLLRGSPTRSAPPVRPPWALVEEVFTSRCDRCGDCVRACPERVIRLGSGGFPEMDFSARGCCLCGDCVSICGGKALAGDPVADKPWDLVAQVGDACLARRGVVCRSCGEACSEGAVRFRLRVGGAAEPMLDEARCTGCGWCVGVCPVRAVRVAAAAGGSGSETQGEHRST